MSDLENGSRLGNSAIVAGALIARDGNGVERARFGQLADGSFGMTGRIDGSTITGGSVVTQSLTVVDDDGVTALPVGQALFGIRVATQGASVAISAASPISFVAVGPEVTVTTPTGKILITGSARIQGNGAMTDGPVAALQVRTLAGAEVYAPGTGVGKIAAFAASTGQPVTVPLIGLVTGLQVGGVYKCRFLYGAAGTAAANAASASSAIIVAQPY
ncbi:hypothetical protein [Nakamurella panacisegetis]|uniref:hypothetical protein n=1 Tax=Nakamurella panacisegetis TaxID=1090615 RepID=UPI0012FDD43E|nr:hypothetical protein [Nakamurella panacisegetis]